MEFKDEKRRLYRHLIVHGAKQSEFRDVAAKEHVAAPDELISKWENRFYDNPIETFPTEPRLINRFCVGADPEFVFESTVQNALERVTSKKYIHAENLGLNTTDAFGCDMSGRQAELRAYPSRFVLEVVSSLVDTLRWMNEVCCLDKYNWMAPAKYNDDGIGGHIHIGRRRPDAPVCIESLDAVTRLLLDAGVMDAEGQKNRAAITAYGRYGDWRPQSHGYEYRTMPSWMTSPWAAYFVLTVSKLCVLDDAREFIGNKRPQETLTNLLRAFKARDDDARIALLALDKMGFPKYLANDFKERWGVVKSSNTISAVNHYFPPIIMPSEATNHDLFTHLVSGQPMRKCVPLPTWKPFDLPKGFFKPDVQNHVYGVSDVAQGLLCRDFRSYFNRTDSNRFYVQCTKKIDEELLKKECAKHIALRDVKATFRPLTKEGEHEVIYISIPANIYDNHLHATNKDMKNAFRAVLTESGLLPFVKYSDFDKPPVAAPELLKKTRRKPLGRVVSRIQGEQERKQPRDGERLDANF